MKRYCQSITVCVLLLFVLCSGCLTTGKMNAYVAQQYNNQLPREAKKKNGDISITSSIPSGSSELCSTVRKRDKFLPLLVYWRYDHRLTTSLNPAIAVTNFSNTINSVAGRGLTQKLAGQQLQLTVERAPGSFALVMHEHMIWVVYTINWMKVYMEPDPADLVVSYKVLQNGSDVKTGKIIIANTARNKGLRLFQSWKSATSEYVSYYNTEMTNMTRLFVNKLMEEL